MTNPAITVLQQIWNPVAPAMLGAVMLSLGTLRDVPLENPPDYVRDFLQYNSELPSDLAVIINSSSIRFVCEDQ